MNLLNDLYLTPEALANGWAVDWDPDLLTLRFRGKEIAGWSASTPINFSTLRSQIWAEITAHEAASKREELSSTRG